MNNSPIYTSSIRSILAASLLLLSEAFGHGQSPTAAPQAAPAAQPPAPAANAEPSPPTPMPSATGSGGGERRWSGPPQTEGPKTFWETVPATIKPPPRTGNFAIAPSGPGYYTFVDLFRGREFQDRPKNPYLQWGQNANPFFNVDFRYLDNPNNDEFFLGDSLKRIHLGDNWLFNTGGEVRDRYTNLDNAYLYNKKPLAGSNEAFNVFRVRVYGDLSYRDFLRVYAEFTSASTSAQVVPPPSSDIDYASILNLFVEAKVLPLGDSAVYLRGGRQELLFGSQRLISPSDWGNELKTFEGVRAIYHTAKIEEDAFWVQPVVVSSAGHFDSVDGNQVFTGNYFKYRFNKDTSLDLYYLYLENNNKSFAGQRSVPGGYDVNTFGSRLVGQAGDHGQYLWDFEGAYQFGKWSNQNTSANMYVLGAGYWFKKLPGMPTFWAYYDHASGTRDPVNGTEHETFNTLFPSGHNYFNAEDLFGRENINDFHLELAAFPANWMRATLGYHVLNLDEAKDSLYNSSGSSIRLDATGKSGVDVGQALDASVQFHIDNHQMINISYAHLFSGTFIKDTAVNAAAAKDSDSVWFTYQMKW